MSTVPEIVGIEKVVDALGAWPSFHDAEILRLALDRDPNRAGEAPTLQLQVRVRRYREQGIGTADFQLALTHDVVIELAFSDISDLEISGFNGQNVIDDIDLRQSKAGDTIAVQIESVYGVGASWHCRAVTVSEVRAVHGVA